MVTDKENVHDGSFLVTKKFGMHALLTL